MAQNAWNLNSKVRTFTEPKLDRVYLPTFLSFIIFCGIWILLIVVFSFKYSKNIENNVQENNNTFFLKVFAYQPHWTKVCSTKRSKKTIKCLDGIRAISTFWVMLSHLQGCPDLHSQLGLQNLKFKPIFLLFLIYCRECRQNKKWI